MISKTPHNWDFIQYEESDSYSDRMYKCLEKIETDLCFLHHEDMFLYAAPDKELLSIYENIVLNEDIDFIRLLRSVDIPSFRYRGIETLSPVPSHSQYFLAFSLQYARLKAC